MAHIAMVICKGVTESPWPMGIWAIETFVQFFKENKVPWASASKGTPVFLPKPKSQM